MKVMMEFELPFEDCSKCQAFQPIVDKPQYEVDTDLKTIKFTRTLTCKGNNFCKYISQNILKG